jgi:hypothetical protein
MGGFVLRGWGSLGGRVVDGLVARIINGVLDFYFFFHMYIRFLQLTPTLTLERLL